MADIALLVTEQFEKTARRGAEAAGEGSGSGSGRNFGAVAKVWSSWVESASAAAAGLRVNVAVELGGLEPKTGLAKAAVDGLFSA